jgi:prophage regulatory protein
MKTAEAIGNDVRIIRFPEVVRRTGLSRTELYSRLRNGEFPSKVPLGPRAVGFVEREVDEYICDLIQRVRGNAELKGAR